jgi:hypothetical protein
MGTRPALLPLTKISERLFLGSSDNAEELVATNPHRIRTALTLSESPVRRRAANVRYLHFPVRDARPIKHWTSSRTSGRLLPHLFWSRASPTNLRTRTRRPTWTYAIIKGAVRSSISVARTATRSTPIPRATLADRSCNSLRHETTRGESKAARFSAANCCPESATCQAQEPSDRLGSRVVQAAS